MKILFIQMVFYHDKDIIKHVVQRCLTHCFAQEEEEKDHFESLKLFL